MGVGIFLLFTHFAFAAAKSAYVPQQIQPKTPALIESWAKRNGKLQTLHVLSDEAPFDVKATGARLTAHDHVRILIEVSPDEVRRMNVQEISRKIVALENAARRAARDAEGWASGRLTEYPNGVPDAHDATTAIVSLFPARPRHAARMRQQVERWRDQAKRLRTRQVLLSLSPPVAGYFSVILEGRDVTHHWFEFFENMARTQGWRVIEVTRVRARDVAKFGVARQFLEWSRSTCARLLAGRP